VMVTFDTTAFPNGSRAIKVAGYSGEYVAVTPVWVAVFNNPYSAHYCVCNLYLRAIDTPRMRGGMFRARR